MGVDIKICGLRTEEALNAAVAGGAAYAGFVFFPPSPRDIDIAAASRLVEAARGRIQTVALFVDPDEEILGSVIDVVKPDFIQLHGSEKPLVVREIREWSGLPVIKAVSVRSEADALRGLAYRGVADFVLFDARPAPSATTPGGNGETFDWSALDKVKYEMRFMLSGGLTPANVAEAIMATSAPAVDVSSGVEKAKGVKDPDLIRRFCAAAKSTIFEELEAYG